MIAAMERVMKILLACVALLLMETSGQTATPSAPIEAAAKALGYTDAEIEKIKHGAIISKDLKEGSPKELAGVVAILLPKPVGEFAAMTLEGALLKFDSSIRPLHVWKPDDSAEKAFADLRDAAGQQAMLKERYEAYRKNGLKGVLPYNSEGKNAASAGELLSLAIKETKSIDRVPGYSKALLNYPSDSLRGMEHRFFAYKQEVEGRPTFILSHRAAVRGEHDALITEQRYYVSHTYDCRFIASDCFEVSGGTLLFYVNRTFTDQVAGMGSGMKHSIGRKKMLSGVADSLKRIREQLQK